MPYTRVTASPVGGTWAPLVVGSPWIDAEPIYGGAFAANSIRSLVNGTITLEGHWIPEVAEADPRGYPPVMVDNSLVGSLQVCSGCQLAHQLSPPSPPLLPQSAGLCKAGHFLLSTLLKK